ncbi:SOS response-associated peptidase [Nesterenkonia salmonea]|uniref:Abasic site processing protein n=1 Tax=Nesterenkonia salmonea TaxID=1804987 RepID=A0A5R9B2U8_9MICC|nr:SOS response-associated peptidase [Nesterenkonia salmonea]TLP90506.1 SOS response-associated peptidase [Nesterenkonia salmonea]
MSPFDARVVDGVELRESYNVAPTTSVPIVLEHLDDDELARELVSARWGLLPIWAKDASFSARTFNARSETVAEKASFRSAVRSKRCAVPADAYYEWLKEGTVKRPHAIRPADGSSIAFAGLYEWWKDPQAVEDDQWVLSTTILTGPSPEPGSGGVLDDLAGLHDRLPLPLSQKTLSEWLHPEKLEKADAISLVDMVREDAFEVASGWEVYEVSRDVGNVRNNSPDLLEPITPGAGV